MKMELKMVWVLHLWPVFVTISGRVKDGCPSPEWSMNIPRQRCIRFYPELHDFASAEQMCRREDSSIPTMNMDEDRTTAFQYLYLNFTNSSFQFWTINTPQTNEERVVNKRTIDEDRDICEYIEIGREWNISRRQMICRELSSVLCEYRITESHDALLPKDLLSMDTRDVIAIGAGIFIAVVFCLVVMMDIIKHLRNSDKMATGPQDV